MAMSSLLITVTVNAKRPKDMRYQATTMLSFRVLDIAYLLGAWRSQSMLSFRVHGYLNIYLNFNLFRVDGPLDAVL